MEIEDITGLTAAATGAAPLAPPAAWFDMPEPDEPTPLTVTDDGQVYGHAALWPTCHTAFQGKCVQPPKSPSGYGYFHLGEVATAEGERVSVGKITMDTGHATIQAGAQAALAHYDNTGTTVAYVKAADGKHGIWVRGAIRPDAPAEKAAALRGSSVSGDWRRPRPGSALEMIGLLAVNVPGFPVPRSQALTAAGDLFDGDVPEDEPLFAMVAAGFPAPEELTEAQLIRKLDILEARSHGLDFLADLVFRPEELAMRALSASSGKPLALCGSCKAKVASGAAKCPECGARMKKSPMDSMQAAAWDPSKHPREPSGSRAGGRWAFTVGDRVSHKPEKSKTPRVGTVMESRDQGTDRERHLVVWDSVEGRPKGSTGYFPKAELAKAKPIMQPPTVERYPPEQGGHPRGWGLGPKYELKSDQLVGREGGVAPAAKVVQPKTDTLVTREGERRRRKGL